jgi:linoleoyl-CoA desaturase
VTDDGTAGAVTGRAAHEPPGSEASHPPSPKVAFASGGAFLDDVRREVDAYLADPAVARRGRRALFLKAVVAIGLMGLGWSGLMLASPGPFLAAACLVALTLGAMLTAFSVQHDANHGAFFRRTRHNHLLGWSSDALLGYSSYVWRVKHNVAHHTYTNVDGYDDDIEQLPIVRLAPSQPSRWWYRWQHVYVWPLYCLFTLKMQFVGDLGALLRGRVGNSAVRVPKGWSLAGYLAGKAVFFGWILVLPLLVYPWWAVLGALLAISAATGLVVAVTFQLAHCVEEASFTSPAELRAERRVWAVHEVESTVDFCPGNRVITWFVGGLNYQIEHHLFPRVAHVHYPRLAAIVERQAAIHGVRYSVHHTLGRALRSHLGHLRWMGARGLPVELEMG